MALHEYMSRKKSRYDRVGEKIMPLHCFRKVAVDNVYEEHPHLDPNSDRKQRLVVNYCEGFGSFVYSDRYAGVCWQ